MWCAWWNHFPNIDYNTEFGHHVPKERPTASRLIVEILQPFNLHETPLNEYELRLNPNVLILKAFRQHLRLFYGYVLTLKVHWTYGDLQIYGLEDYTPLQYFGCSLWGGKRRAPRTWLTYLFCTSRQVFWKLYSWVLSFNLLFRFCTVSASSSELRNEEGVGSNEISARATLSSSQPSWTEMIWARSSPLLELPPYARPLPLRQIGVISPHPTKFAGVPAVCRKWTPFCPTRHFRSTS